jgi:hypothetical protein
MNLGTLIIRRTKQKKIDYRELIIILYIQINLIIEN